MAQNTILAENTQSTVFLEAYGVFGFVIPFDSELPEFPLALGDECVVAWDGVEYNVTTGDSSAFMAGTKYVGNGAAFGLAGNNEPFVIAWDSAGATFVSFTDTAPTSHTVSIYQTVEDEPQEEVGIVIKNYSGVPIEYKGVEKVMFNTSDGGKRVYSKGEALEDVSIELDFSSGDQTVKAAEGTLIKSVVIKKPDTLVDENIAEGINVAGIIGTLASGGSGGGKLVVKTGEFTPTTYSHTVTHGLGTVPIFARLMPTTGFPSETNVSVLYFVDGISTELANMAGMTERLQYGAYMNSYRQQLSQFASSYGIDYASTSLAIANANANAITFGSASYRLTTARTWSWLVVGFETTE